MSQNITRTLRTRRTVVWFLVALVLIGALLLIPRSWLGAAVAAFLFAAFLAFVGPFGGLRWLHKDWWVGADPYDEPTGLDLAERFGPDSDEVRAYRRGESIPTRHGVR
ncbi:hypothetical protein [Microbacterium enclense]|uniref:hypothetical protein n=1 Tax=Microbacterium enclense TaxID=993073 RepID=UPI003F7F582F